MEITGLALFITIKYAGYYLYLSLIAPKEHLSKVYVIAFVRLIAGLLTGMTIHFLFTSGRDIFPVYLSAILIGRLAIWFLIFHLFYRQLTIGKKMGHATGGTVISYILDIPSTFGFLVVVGGIC